MTTVLNQVENAMTQDGLLDVLYSACLTLGDNAGQQSKAAHADDESTSSHSSLSLSSSSTLQGKKTHLLKRAHRIYREV